MMFFFRLLNGYSTVGYAIVCPASVELTGGVWVRAQKEPKVEMEKSMPPVVFQKEQERVISEIDETQKHSSEKERSSCRN
jgi:hypothetical protein